MDNQYFMDSKLTDNGKKELVSIIKLQELAVMKEAEAKKSLDEANKLLSALFNIPKGASLSWHDVIKSLL
jgi:hemerythrin